MKFVSQSLKAFYAAASAFLSSLGVVVIGNASISDVTTAQWIWIAGATLGAFGVVFGVSNQPK